MIRLGEVMSGAALPGEAKMVSKADYCSLPFCQKADNKDHHILRPCTRQMYTIPGLRVQGIIFVPDFSF